MFYMGSVEYVSINFYCGCFLYCVFNIYFCELGSIGFGLLDNSGYKCICNFGLSIC